MFETDNEKEQVIMESLNINRIYDEAKRLSDGRGWTPDLTDMDKIVEDAIDMAKSAKAITTDDVVNALDLLIATNN